MGNGLQWSLRVLVKTILPTSSHRMERKLDQSRKMGCQWIPAIQPGPLMGSGWHLTPIYLAGTVLASWNLTSRRSPGSKAVNGNAIPQLGHQMDRTWCTLP